MHASFRKQMFLMKNLWRCCCKRFLKFFNVEHEYACDLLVAGKSFQKIFSATQTVVYDMNINWHVDPLLAATSL